MRKRNIYKMEWLSNGSHFFIIIKGDEEMSQVYWNNFRNLSALEQDLNTFGKGNDFSAILDEAIDQISTHEGTLEGLLNVRKDYESDSIVCIFHVVENEEKETRGAVDIIYHGTNHYS